MKWTKELQYLWGEYQYRHDLVWRTLLRLGFVVAFLSVIPYAKDTLTVELGPWMTVPPILATILSIFGVFVVNNELRLLEKIRNIYRFLQNDFFKEIYQGKKEDAPKHEFGRMSLFNIFVWLFLATLIVLSTGNLIFLYYTGSVSR